MILPIEQASSASVLTYAFFGMNQDGAAVKSALMDCEAGGIDSVIIDTSVHFIPCRPRRMCHHCRNSGGLKRRKSMARSNYIKRYLSEAKSVIANESNPKWMRDFFTVFRDQLLTRSKDSSPGNKYIVTGSFREAFVHKLFPKRISVKAEKMLSDFVININDESLQRLLSRKRVDFLIEGNGNLLFIEFKTNVQFNDHAAAMVEMALLKKYIRPEYKNKIKTASLHLFPFTTNVKGLMALNKELGMPLDDSWILCTKNLEFDRQALIDMRKSILEIIG